MKLNITDGFALFSKLTLRKINNSIKVLASFYVSKISRTPVHWGMPLSISIEPTTSCNLRCPECPSGKREFTRPTGMLDIAFFKKTIDELHKELINLTFYFQGEPYLNPNFLEMVNYASSKNIFTTTSTNAHFIDDETARKTIESGLGRIIISIDGATQETYEQYRVGGQLEKVVEGTKQIIAWKKKLNSTWPLVVFQFLVVKPNEHETEKIIQLAKQLGVDEIQFKTAQIYDYTNGNKLIPTNEKYSRYQRLSDGSYRLKNKLHNHCWKMWHSAVITWDGLVVPCCFDKDAQHRMGNLKSRSFNEIWAGSEYTRFRTSILKSRSEIDICKNCTEGTKVWA